MPHGSGGFQPIQHDIFVAQARAFHRARAWDGDGVGAALLDFSGVRQAPGGDFRVRAIAFVVLAVGITGYLWCALDFAFRGKGTPAPIDPPKILVAKGLYKYTRNPMYISVLTVLAGECVLFWSPQLVEYAAAVAVGFHLFVLIYEEPALTRKMGAAYEQYRREVPRWIPRIAPRPSNDSL